MNKIQKYTLTLEQEISRDCLGSDSLTILKWLLERQKIYVGRWLGFVSLKQISPKGLVENDFFLAIKICAKRIDSQLTQVYTSSSVGQNWVKFKLEIDDIEGDFSISKADSLMDILNIILSDLNVIN